MKTQLSKPGRHKARYKYSIVMLNGSIVPASQKLWLRHHAGDVRTCTRALTGLGGSARSRRPLLPRTGPANVCRFGNVHWTV